MRVVQWRLLNDIFNHIKIPEYVYAFEKGKSIPAMAALHTNKAFVVSVDIKDFFPSITQWQIQALCESLKIGVGPSRLISELSCYKSYLPQGALTSPKISNLISAATFGPELKKYCDEKGLTLTIYADDITISGNPDIDLKQPMISRPYFQEILQKIREELKSWGFRVNREKTKIMFQSSRQWVCGAVVNRKTNLINKERRRLRAIVHNCEKNGIAAEAAKTKMTEVNFVRKYMGRINWYCQLNPQAGVKLHTPFKRMAAEVKRQFPDFEIPELAYTVNEGHEAELELLPEHGKSVAPEASKTAAPVSINTTDTKSSREEVAQEVPWA